MGRVAFGGVVELKGPRYINYPTFTEETIDAKFMLPERALVKALLSNVFNKIDNIAYMRELTPFKEVGSGFKFDTRIAFRKTTLVFHALGEPESHTYRVLLKEAGRASVLIYSNFNLPIAG